MTTPEEQIQNNSQDSLPEMIQDFLHGVSGTEVPNEVLYKGETVDAIKAKVVESFREGVNEGKLEALGFLIWLEEASDYLESHNWSDKSNTKPFNTNPEEAGHDFILDCIPSNDKFIEEISSVPLPEGVSLVEASRVNFVTSESEGFPNGGSQNVTYLNFREQNIDKHYLVDVATYHYKPVWAKAFEGKDKIEVLKKGRDWLKGNHANSRWTTAELATNETGKGMI